MINSFFNAALEAIVCEEHELNGLFKFNEKYYKRNHHGVCNLYETTFVYLIFKELLRQAYPFTVHWEYPYPSHTKEHCDLALLNEEGTLEALIEFKIWTTDDDRAIKRDILKLQKEHNCKKYIFIIGYGGDLEENHHYLMRDHAPLKLVNKRSIQTKFFKVVSNTIEDSALNLFMYEVV